MIVDLEYLVKRILVYSLLSTIMCVGSLRAEDATPAVPVRAVLSTTAIPSGGASQLGVQFDVPKRHHITDVEYGLFFVEAPDTFGLDFGTPVFPPGEKFHDEHAYRGKNLVRVPIQATADAQPGSYTIPVKIGYQMCQEFGQEVCFLPVETELSLTVNIVAAGTKVDAANADVFKAKSAKPEPEKRKRSLEERLMAALDEGSWMAFLIAFIGGVLASFTPCVYPVIPITIGYIGGSSGGKPMRGLGLSAIFALGIAVVYSSLGLFAAATGNLFGSISSSPLVNVVVALVFGLMGVSMLGVFDIALPSALQTALSGGSSKRGLFGPLLLGMASGLVMAPCVGPIIVALLAWVAKTGNLFYGWSLLFVFSFGLGLLFLVIGTFSGAIQALPRAGAWMENVKKAFGWILLAGSLYMLRFLLPEPYYSLTWAALLIVASVFLGGFDALTAESTGGRRFGKALALMIFLVGAISLYRAIGPHGTTVETAGPQMTWLVNKEADAFAQAQSENKPLLIDVYADWCSACVELDEKTYVVPDVINRVDGFVRLKLDFTKEDDWVKEMKSKYKITGMPTVILISSSGDEVTRFTGFKPARDFISLLDEHNL
jgi:thioredoxin:protein disulfide reductase